MNKHIYSISLILFVFAGIKTYSQPEGDVNNQDSLLILKNGTIISLSIEGADLKTGTMVIEKDEIIEISYQNSNYDDYPNAQVIDLKGKYVMPGLIDAHVHLATQPKEDRKENNEFMESQLAEMLYSGITSVRDMAGNAIIIADYTRASRLNHIPAPDIFYAAQFAGPEYFGLIRSFGSRIETKSDSPWEQTITDDTNLELAVAMAKGAGVTGIKIYNDLSQELVEQITNEAHTQGLQAWSHSAVFPASPYAVAKSKVNTMSHAWDFMYGLKNEEEITTESLESEIDYDQLDKILLTMKENNVILDATNYIAENNNMTNGVKVTKRAHELGVKIGVGTDWPYVYEPEIPLFKEMRLLTEKCGFTNAEVLHSVTKINAECIGVEDRGVIEVGKRADILVIDKNPLENLDNVRESVLIVKAGIVFKPHIY